jgi:hypothetical protein
MRFSFADNGMNLFCPEKPDPLGPDFYIYILFVTWRLGG